MLAVSLTHETVFDGMCSLEIKLFLLHILIFQALFIEFSTIQFLFLGHNEANLFVISVSYIT